jgi:hypothetical protein
MGAFAVAVRPRKSSRWRSIVRVVSQRRGDVDRALPLFLSGAAEQLLAEHRLGRARAGVIRARVYGANRGADLGSLEGGQSLVAHHYAVE